MKLPYMLSICHPEFISKWGFSVHGIFQARILEWVTISFSRGSSRPRDRTQVSRIGGRHFNLWASIAVPYLKFYEISQEVVFLFCLASLTFLHLPWSLISAFQLSDAGSCITSCKMYFCLVCHYNLLFLFSRHFKTLMTFFPANKI